VGKEREDRSAPAKLPQPKPFTGADGDFERFTSQLTDYFGLARITNERDTIGTAGMLCEGKARSWYETYRLEMDRRMAMRVLGKSGHSWTDCWAKESNGSAGSSEK
jgi:hypothetical protein